MRARLSDKIAQTLVRTRERERHADRPRSIKFFITAKTMYQNSVAE